MKKICFVTGSRADYGIMAPLMKEIKDSANAELQIIATNMHLSEKYGMTVNEIINDGFVVDFRIDSMIGNTSANSTVKAMAKTIEGFSDAFDLLKPDIIVILGDRYEMMMAASAANIYNIPIAHLHGGEITEGAYDDAFRHAITKLSSLHFVATEPYRKRIIQMGEDPENVFVSGAPGVENILNEELVSPDSLSEELDFDLTGDYFIVTFHPTTRQPGEEDTETNELMEAMKEYISKGFKFLITLPNSDTGSDNIRTILENLSNNYKESVKLVSSLGRKRFFSVLAGSKGIIGNSSSGLIEAPTFRIPTINIGNRQKGRIAGESVINVPAKKEHIADAIEKAVSPGFIAKIKSLSLHELNPYYKTDTKKFIADKLINLKPDGFKRFYDLAFEL